jgi:hypothetical protein
MNGEQNANSARKLLNINKIQIYSNWIPKTTLEKGLDMCVVEKNK